VPKNLKSLFVATGLICQIVLGLPAFAGSITEVVQSTPLETTLEVPGIRQTQQVWLEMIHSAQSTIDLEEFYLNNKSGEPLSEILAAIREAALRGVQVRLLVDSKFYKNYSQEPLLLSRIPNVQVKMIDFFSGVQHSKYLIVDQFDLYLGSANFDWLALTHIHEIGLHIQDSALGQRLEAVFVKDWNDSIGLGDLGLEQCKKQVALSVPPSFDRGSSLVPNDGVKLVASPSFRNPSGISDSLSAILQLLNTAKNSIKIQVYQYSTHGNHSSKRWLDLDATIRRAAKRGVNVQLLVDAVSLKAGRYELQALSALNHVEVRTVTIPEWSGGHLDYARLVHSKYFTIDGSSAWVGTENWSEGYFTGSRNVGVILESSEVARQLEQVFNQVWNSAYASSSPLENKTSEN
jgi:phosphatidylserine/phosphatidylglycerophosphate/cardiolipin synthase-like enzyme